MSDHLHEPHSSEEPVLCQLAQDPRYAEARRIVYDRVRETTPGPTGAIATVVAQEAFNAGVAYLVGLGIPTDEATGNLRALVDADARGSDKGRIAPKRQSPWRLIGAVAVIVSLVVIGYFAYRSAFSDPWPPGTGYLTKPTHRPRRPHEVASVNYEAVIGLQSSLLKGGRLSFKGERDGVPVEDEPVHGFIIRTTGDVQVSPQEKEMPQEKEILNRLELLKKHSLYLKSRIESDMRFSMRSSKIYKSTIASKETQVIMEFEIYELFQTDRIYAYPGLRIRVEEPGLPLELRDFNGDTCTISPGMTVIVDKYGQFMLESKGVQHGRGRIGAD